MLVVSGQDLYGLSFYGLSGHRIGTWDMEEFLSKRDEIVNGDKLKVRMVF